jgi:hypothetical protein
MTFSDVRIGMRIESQMRTHQRLVAALEKLFASASEGNRSFAGELESYCDDLCRRFRGPERKWTFHVHWHVLALDGVYV